VAFITDDVLKDKLASELKVLGSGLTDAAWDNIIHDSNSSAKNEILTKLYARGYSLTQIQTWDRVEEFQTDIGLYWCLVKGANLSLATITLEIIKLHDRRGELDEIGILEGGVIVPPDDTTVGGEVSAGEFDTSTDRYYKDMPL
jgi:hypothetical protein